MSFDTNKNWFYELHGRFLHLWQWVETAATDTVGSYRVKLPAEYYGNQLIYPNEDITDGLRVEYTAFSEPFVAESLEDTSARASSAGISFSGGVISDTNNKFGDFAQSDKIRIIGSNATSGGVLTADDLTRPGSHTGWQTSQSHSNVEQTSTSGSGTGIKCDIATDGSGFTTFTIVDSGSGYAVNDTITFTDPGSTSNTAVLTVATIRTTNNAEFTLSSSGTVNSTTLTLAGTDLFLDEAAGESITIYQIPLSVTDANVDESSHLNLNRMLSLAAVDYVRAQMKEAVGDLQGKEYCMREFWKKIGDNESNKRNISMTFPASPFAVK